MDDSLNAGTCLSSSSVCAAKRLQIDQITTLMLWARLSQHALALEALFKTSLANSNWPMGARLANEQSP
jgi:hypothetical protein